MHWYNSQKIINQQKNEEMSNN